MGRSSSLRLPNITVCFRTCHWNEPHLDIPRYGKEGLLFNSLRDRRPRREKISYICGLGASVGCERVERTFNTPRLKSQICLIRGNGFCAVAGESELNRGGGLGTRCESFCLLEKRFTGSSVYSPNHKLLFSFCLHILK